MEIEELFQTQKIKTSIWFQLLGSKNDKCFYILNKRFSLNFDNEREATKLLVGAVSFWGDKVFTISEDKRKFDPITLSFCTYGKLTAGDSFINKILPDLKDCWFVDYQNGGYHRFAVSLKKLRLFSEGVLSK